MALTAVETAKIVKKYQRFENDTGSPEVQIALLTMRIQSLTSHMRANVHDYHTRYGLTNLVSQRRKMMNYLKKTNKLAYQKLIEALEIRAL